MTIKSTRAILAIGAAVCALAVFCLAGGIALFLRVFPPLPVYLMEQVPSEHEGYIRTTLTNGETVYANDYEESALVTFGPTPTQMIGRFPASEEPAIGLYAIPGQEPSAYALEYDPMYQVVYRNVRHPPFDWREADFQMMRLYLPTNPVETTDAQMIAEILSALKEGGPFIVPFQADGNYAAYQNHTLMSFSDELTGLAYVFGVHVAADGTVYLAENQTTGQWSLAGPLFTEWVNLKR